MGGKIKCVKIGTKGMRIADSPTSQPVVVKNLNVKIAFSMRSYSLQILWEKSSYLSRLYPFLVLIQLIDSS